MVSRQNDKKRSAFWSLPNAFELRRTQKRSRIWARNSDKWFSASNMRTQENTPMGRPGRYIPFSIDKLKDELQAAWMLAATLLPIEIKRLLFEHPKNGRMYVPEADSYR